jgi:hypothetical protein
MSCSTYDKYMSAFQINSNGKASLIQNWKNLEVSRKLMHPEFKTVGTWSLYVCQEYATAAINLQEIFLVLI